MSEMTPEVPSNTGPDLRKSQPFALASGQFRGTVFVCEFLATEVRPWIATHQITDDASAVLMTQLLRVDSWLRTLAKLDDPADFQGVAAACRSLLETTIDIALIRGSPQKHEQLLAWEESAKLYHAEHVVKYLSAHNIQRPNDVIGDFVTQHKNRIETLRRRFGWLNAKKDRIATRHPQRWTDHNLADDAKGADALGHRFKFEYFYETEYRRTCWSVHGSGFPLRGIPAVAFPSLAGLLFPHCCDLALLSAELVLRHFGLWSPEREQRFIDVSKRRIVIVGQTMRVTMGMPLLTAPTDDD
jgi:Family of unknown function (DUF5677)